NGYFKVTLMRSPIGLPPKTRKAVTSLGLKKLHQTVFKIRNEVSVGHIFKVKELVKIE
ncbi:50S ribosomal protein L30, partial [Neoconidiobolus thromboides FSU 785]